MVRRKKLKNALTSRSNAQVGKTLFFKSLFHLKKCIKSAEAKKLCKNATSYQVIF